MRLKRRRRRASVRGVSARVCEVVEWEDLSWSLVFDGDCIYDM